MRVSVWEIVYVRERGRERESERKRERGLRLCAHVWNFDASPSFNYILFPQLLLQLLLLVEVIFSLELFPCECEASFQHLLLLRSCFLSKQSRVTSLLIYCEDNFNYY